MHLIFICISLSQCLLSYGRIWSSFPTIFNQNFYHFFFFWACAMIIWEMSLFTAINFVVFELLGSGWGLRACKNSRSQRVRPTQGCSYWRHHWWSLERHLRPIAQHSHQAHGRWIPCVCPLLRHTRRPPFQDLQLIESREARSAHSCPLSTFSPYCLSSAVFLLLSFCLYLGQSSCRSLFSWSTTKLRRQWW